LIAGVAIGFVLAGAAIRARARRDVAETATT
jgi:hypothetical protein